MRWIALLLMLWPGWLAAACRQALVLAVDVSASVDALEYRQQLDGIAAALGSQAVSAILFDGSAAPVDIAVFEWSGPRDHAVIVPWTSLSDPGDLAVVQRTLANHPRRLTDETTAIGSALLRGFDLLAERPDCWKRTLDISGDGPSNTGPRPETIGPDAMPAGVTVNALVVAASAGAHDRRQAEIKELSSYFTTRVIRGPGAFVEAALGYVDYANAMERKLLRELASVAIGRTDMAGQ